MTRLIDADALLKELRKSCEYHAENSREFSLLQRNIIIVQEQPTIDAASIRRGTWSEEYDPNDDVFFRRKFRCSACNGWNTYGFTKYCPDCGAKMENAREYDAEKE